MAYQLLRHGFDELLMGQDVTSVEPGRIRSPYAVASLFRAEARRRGLRCDSVTFANGVARLTVGGLDLRVQRIRRERFRATLWLPSAWLHRNAASAYRVAHRALAPFLTVPGLSPVGSPFVAEVVLFVDFQGATFAVSTLDRLVTSEDKHFLRSRSRALTIDFGLKRGLLYDKGAEIEAHPWKNRHLVPLWIASGRYTRGKQAWRVELRFRRADLERLGLPSDLAGLFGFGLDRCSLRRRRKGNPDPRAGGEDPVWRWLRSHSFPAPWSREDGPSLPPEPPAPLPDAQRNGLHGSIATALGTLLASEAPETGRSPGAMLEAYCALLEADPERGEVLVARLEKALAEAGIEPSDGGNTVVENVPSRR
jgi:hypothetical protein